MIKIKIVNTVILNGGTGVDSCYFMFVLVGLEMINMIALLTPPHQPIYHHSHHLSPLSLLSVTDYSQCTTKAQKIQV